MFQTIAIIIAVVICIFFIGIKLYRQFKRAANLDTSGGCGCSCSGCDNICDLPKKDLH
ncbi:MAG: FeoB-associated Cys-rich membrane protein [Desulfobulbaceae bacterium]|uniref:FeoB-associated Cys-rich membrane protein n=1 Tax=Candidatus Desulfatifera sulfidica TaxID=2841691 RepID=A0A8J6TDS6_9BACT|nr:FeoB-associated Cys-rich membrane protein [Candidatus Desulfatifera sulfidica]